MSKGDTDERTVRRRQVLSGIGGAAAFTPTLDPTASDEDVSRLADRMAEEFDGVSTAADRRELEYLLGELRTDAQLLADRELTSFSPEKRQEFAEKGRRLRNLAGDCGYGGNLGSMGGCCTAHDRCETADGGGWWDDSIFNGDSCDDAFYDCVGDQLANPNRWTV